MNFYNESFVVLMMQRPYTAFCYYNISNKDIQAIKKKYGKNSWEESKPVLKVYEVKDEEEKQIEYINLDPFADNWYINLKNDDLKIKVKIGRVVNESEFIELATSNIINTPRAKQSQDLDVRYLDLKSI